MHHLLDSILVVGHFNPDTDAAASAACYAHLLNQIERYDRSVLATVPGPMTPQTKYVFERAGIELPLIIDDIQTRVGHVMTRSPKTISEDDRLGTAFERLVRDDVSVLPIVDEHNRLSGTFSNRSDASRFLLSFDPAPLWGSLLSLDDLLNMPNIKVVHQHDADPPSTVGNEIQFALEGNDAWVQRIRRGDVLVSGGLNSLDKLDASQMPCCIIVLGSTDLRGTTRLAAAKQAGITVLQYGLGLAAFTNSLAQRIRLGAMHLPAGMCVGELDRLSDIASLATKTHHALPVIDDDNRLCGILSRSDLKRKHRSQVILVDHFERPQAVKGIENAEVLEILDHHRVGDIQTGSPIRVQCRPVGSTCTIVAENYFHEGVVPKPGIALLMLSGIIADTLMLTGPTTTTTDIQIAQRLASLAGVDLQTYGHEVLSAADDLKTSDPASIWHRDRKQFSIRNQQLSIAQLETASLESLPEDRLDEFRNLLQRDHESKGNLLSLLVITDVIKRNSWISACEANEAEGITAKTFASKADAGIPPAGWVHAAGVVSRKKQIVPQLMATLAAV